MKVIRNPARHRAQTQRAASQRLSRRWASGGMVYNTQAKQSAITMADIERSLALVQGKCITIDRGVLIAPVMESVVRKQIEDQRPAGEFTLFQFHPFGIEVFVESWMPRDVIIPVPGTVRTRAQLEDFMLRARISVMSKAASE